MTRTLQLNVCTWTGAVLTLQPKEASTKLGIFKALALIEIKDRVPYGCQLLIIHDGRPLIGEMLSLEEHGLEDGDTLRFELVPPPPSGTPEADAVDEKSDVTFIRDQLLCIPDDTILLQKTNPPLATALLTGDFNTFSDLVKEILHKVEKKRDTNLEEMLRQIGDCEMGKEPSPPNPPPLPKSSAEPSTTTDVNANLLPPKKQEVIPLKFPCEGPTALFVNIKVNGIDVKTFVDPGAKLTTMSKNCANRTKLSSLMESSLLGDGPSSEKTYLRMAKAAASTTPLLKSIGKIRNFNIEIDGHFIISTFTVVETQKWEFVLGQDFLKAHECVIDLGRNLMKVGSCGVKTPFIF